MLIHPLCTARPALLRGPSSPLPLAGPLPPCAERWQSVTKPWDGSSHPHARLEPPELGLLQNLQREPF